MRNTHKDAVVTLSDLNPSQFVHGLDGRITAKCSTFSFNKLTGVAKVTNPDGSTLDQWQCTLLKSASGRVLGWAFPTALQAELPQPDVNITNASGTVIGKAYSTEIPNYWDVPVTDLAGNVTHYAASAVLPDATYVTVTDSSGQNAVYYLAP